MQDTKAAVANPFPECRPEITITPIQEPPFEVDWKELAWWFAVPKVGNTAPWAIYEPPDWQISSFVETHAVRPAVIHGIEGIEIQTVDHEMAGGKAKHPLTIFARLTDTSTQYLAILSLEQGVRRLFTLLDEDFDLAWGESPRIVGCSGRLVEDGPGSYAMKDAESLSSGHVFDGVGMYQVNVGSRFFTCLRALDVRLSEQGILMESYLTREGQTVLCRRYNGRLWKRAGSNAGKPPWDEMLPENDRINVNGITFVHWYDCLSGLACGVPIVSEET